MGNRRFWTVLICVALLMAGSAGAVLAAGDLSAEHNLAY